MVYLKHLKHSFCDLMVYYSTSMNDLDQRKVDVAENDFEESETKCKCAKKQMELWMVLSLF